ncbi:MAG: hypothetical protein WAL22_18650 [Solirubrobacteraceae bacterium]
MVAITVADMSGISGRRDELGTLLQRFGNSAGGEPGGRRYTVTASLADLLNTRPMDPRDAD